MTPELHLDHLATDSARFASATSGALDHDVAFLSDWKIRDLVAHLGGVYSYVVANTAAPSTELAGPGPEGTAPAGDAINEWFAERRTELLTTLSGQDNATPTASHAGLRNIAWWKRRMAAETSVHLWDANAAIDSIDAAEPVESELAMDGLEEYLEVGLRPRPDRVFPTETLHLHRSDGPGEWMLVADDNGGVAITHEHGKGDAAVRGSASDLFLWMWGRPVTGVEIFGDTAVAATWQGLAS